MDAGLEINEAALGERPWRLSPARKAAVALFDTVTAPLGWRGRRAGSQAVVEPRRISVLAFWGIGDAVLLTPLLRALRARFPGAHIELIGKPFLRDLFCHDPAVDEVTVCTPPWCSAEGKYRFLSAGYRRTAGWLIARRRKRADWIIATRGDVREHLFAALMPGGRRFGFADAGGAALLTDHFAFSSPRYGQRHFVTVNRKIADAIGCREDGRGPELRVLPQERMAAEADLKRQGWDGTRPLVGLHLGAGSPMRCWPPERFHNVLRQVGQKAPRVVLLEDPEGMHKRFEAPPSVRVIRGGGPLRHVLGLLSQLDVLLCNDSGIMHAGAALGARVVAVFGPGSLAWFRPYGPRHQVVFNSKMPCRPCLDRCAREHPVCVESVSVEAVRDALLRALVPGEAAFARNVVRRRGNARS